MPAPRITVDCVVAIWKGYCVKTDPSDYCKHGLEAIKAQSQGRSSFLVEEARKSSIANSRPNYLYTQYRYEC